MLVGSRLTILTCVDLGMPDRHRGAEFLGSDVCRHPTQACNHEMDTARKARRRFTLPVEYGQSKRIAPSACERHGERDERDG